MVTVKNAKKFAYKLTPNTIIKLCIAYSKSVLGYIKAKPRPVMDDTTKKTESIYF